MPARLQPVFRLLSIFAVVAACSNERVTFTPEDAAPTVDGGQATCTDATKNGTETDVDCGGPCPACDVGQGCVMGADCVTGVCQGTLCAAASCTDLVKNGDETDVDCGGSCGPCSDGQACSRPGDCTSQVCTSDTCQKATCTDSVVNGDETDLDCGGAASPACSAGKSCAVDSDCASAGVCDALQCRPARSCAEIHLRRPASADGVYRIAPSGSGAPFNVVCDMTRDGGGWTLLLKTAGDTTFAYGAAAWSDTSLLNPTDLTTAPGNAKYPSFLSLPVSTLRGELDGFRYTQPFTGQTVVQIFGGAASYVDGFPTFNTGDPRWSTQPNCHVFGVNLPFSTRARFGWSANQENDCLTNDTAVGLGINGRGAGYRCGSTQCSNGNTDAGGDGLLWGR